MTKHRLKLLSQGITPLSQWLTPFFYPLTPLRNGSTPLSYWFTPTSEATSPFLKDVSHPSGAWSLNEVEVSAGEVLC